MPERPWKESCTSTARPSEATPSSSSTSTEVKACIGLNSMIRLQSTTTTIGTPMMKDFLLPSSTQESKQDTLAFLFLSFCPTRFLPALDLEAITTSNTLFLLSYLPAIKIARHKPSNGHCISVSLVASSKRHSQRLRLG